MVTERSSKDARWACRRANSRGTRRCRCANRTCGNCRSFRSEQQGRVRQDDFASGVHRPSRTVGHSIVDLIKSGRVIRSKAEELDSIRHATLNRVHLIGYFGTKMSVRSFPQPYSVSPTKSRVENVEFVAGAGGEFRDRVLTRLCFWLPLLGSFAATDADVGVFLAVQRHKCRLPQ